VGKDGIHARKDGWLGPQAVNWKILVPAFAQPMTRMLWTGNFTGCL
jgi:hypothetical protein